MTRGTRRVEAATTLTRKEDVRETKMPARLVRNKAKTPTAMGILRIANIVYRIVWRSARRRAITALSRTGAIPRARVQTRMVTTYNGSKANAKFGTNTGTRNKNTIVSATVTRPETVSPSFTRAVLSVDSGRYRMSPTPIPRLPRPATKLSVEKRVIAAPRSDAWNRFATTAQKKKPSPFPMTLVIMRKKALRYREPLTWSQPRPTSSAIRCAASLGRTPRNSHAWIKA